MQLIATDLLEEFFPWWVPLSFQSKSGGSVPGHGTPSLPKSAALMPPLWIPPCHSLCPGVSIGPTLRSFGIGLVWRNLKISQNGITQRTENAGVAIGQEAERDPRVSSLNWSFVFDWSPFCWNRSGSNQGSLGQQISSSTISCRNRALKQWGKGLLAVDAVISGPGREVQQAAHSLGAEKQLWQHQRLWFAIIIFKSKHREYSKKWLVQVCENVF